jgi:transposase
MIERYWVGLDLGETKTHVCVTDDTGLPVLEQDCESTASEIAAVVSRFDRQAIGLMAVEAGTGTHVVRKLRDAGFPVTIFEARKASKFLAVRRNKTDSGDAKGLADIGRIGREVVSQVHLKSLECEHIRGQLVMRTSLVRLRVSLEQILRSRLMTYGRPLNRCYTVEGVRKQVVPALDYIKENEGIDLTEELLPIVVLSEALRTYLKKVDEDLDRTAKTHPICNRLMEVPGVGTLCAWAFYSAIEDPFRFKRVEHVGAYLGLVPRRYQSGELSRTKGITKTGDTLTRTLLVTAALSFLRTAPDCELRQWAFALKDRIGPRRTRVALARKLSIVLLLMWRSGVGFEHFPSRREI